MTHGGQWGCGGHEGHALGGARGCIMGCNGGYIRGALWGAMGVQR